MNTDTFNRLSRLCGQHRSRRSALGALLAITVLDLTRATPATASKTKRKGKRRGKNHGKGEVRVHAQTKSKPGNHCRTPSGLDLNAFMGIADEIVASFCPEIGSGEQWTTSGPWFVGGSYANGKIPDGYVPVSNKPVEDFRAKFEGLRFVIDPDSPQEKTVVVPNTGNVFAGPANAIAPGAPGDALVLIPASLATLQPLSVGNHVVHVYWRFSAMHCDGLGTATGAGGNCLPEGETLYLQLPFKVVAGHHR